jgi:hypothetical protein
VYLIYRQRKLNGIKGFPRHRWLAAVANGVKLGKLENKNGVAGKDIFPTTPEVIHSNVG